MRRLLGLGVVVAVLVAVLGVGDTFARHAAERDVARRIEARVPGTTATVHISSWPFLGRLAASGSVPALDARVTGVRVGPFAVDSVDIAVADLVVSRSDLLHGRVTPRSIRSATVTGVISQQSVDAGTGLPVSLGDGTVGLAGVQVPARLVVVGGRVVVNVPPLPAFSVPLLPAALLPCAAVATITAGAITLSCTTTAIPPALTTGVAG